MFKNEGLFEPYIDMEVPSGRGALNNSQKSLQKCGRRPPSGCTRLTKQKVQPNAKGDIMGF